MRMFLFRVRDQTKYQIKVFRYFFYITYTDQLIYPWLILNGNFI